MRVRASALLNFKRVRNLFLFCGSLLLFTILFLWIYMDVDVPDIFSVSRSIDAEPHPKRLEQSRDHSPNEQWHSNTATSVVNLNYDVHIFYYPWYGNPEFDRRYYHWNHEFIPHWNNDLKDKFPLGVHTPPLDIGANFYPYLGCYSSRDPSIIDQHMKWIRNTLAGVIVISWYPPGMADGNGKSWDDMMLSYFQAAHKYGLKITFHIEPYEGRSVNTLRSDLTYLIETYGSHPALLQHRHQEISKPLFYIYDSYLIPDSDWKALLRPSGVLSIRGKPMDAHIIGLLVKPEDKTALLSNGFDGFYTYFAAKGFTYGSTWQNWPNLRAFAKKNNLLFIPSAGPGYIDERVRPWNKVNIRPRRDGQYFREMWNAAVDAHASTISITSFNEFHEGTQIEPSVPKSIPGFQYLDYGQHGPFFYLDLTRELVEDFTNRTAERNRNYSVFQLNSRQAVE